MLSTEFSRVDLEGLRAKLGYPDPPALQKITDYLDENCKTFLAHSPFATIASSDAAGNCDSSPRGDYPGFVRVIDDRTVVIPDRIGNKIADTMTNILENPHVGLLCFVPGMTETLRINGRAFLTDDPDILRMLEQDHSPPNLAIVVEIDQAYLHCGRALLRSGLWDPEMQDLAAEVPSSGTIWASMSGFDPEIAKVIDDAVAGDGYQNLY